MDEDHVIFGKNEWDMWVWDNEWGVKFYIDVVKDPVYYYVILSGCSLLTMSLSHLRTTQ